MTTETTTKPIRLHVPVTQEGFNTYLTLAVPCKDCDGTGTYWTLVAPGEADREPCPFCEGRGLKLTDAGEAVMRLFEVFCPAPVIDGLGF